ncbi:MAG: MBL fold metallo-hydrolase [Huintestinicola sp.]
MPRIYPLFSSSKGNSVYIGSQTSGILIDCGVSFTRLKKALELNGIGLSAIQAVFITHEHSDHTNGLKMLTKKTGVPVYARSLTLDILYDSGMIGSSAEDMKDHADIGTMKISSFSTSHDAAEPCGYTVEFEDGKKCALCTDLGYVSDEVMAAVQGCEAALIEANYDEEMLRTGIYPAYLKARIRSKVGHLSNKDCGSFAAELVKSGTTRLILGHLSQENNTPSTAYAAVEGRLREEGFSVNKDYLLSCAPVATSGGFVAF